MIGPKQGGPTLAQALRALDRAEACLRVVASQWQDVPAPSRLTLIRGADAAERVLLSAGIR